MKRFSEQLHKKSATVKLQASEKRDIRERLVAYMEYHPLPIELRSKNIDSTQKTLAPIFAEPFKTVYIPFSTLFKSSAVAGALILLLVPFIAERAVPGDTLYAVKVQFNEELRSTLTFDTYQKVEWETERLNRRIAEARLLASEGRLTEEVEAGVAEAVKVHTENAKREIEELRTQDADEAAIASIALDATLEVQFTSLQEEDKFAASISSSTNNRMVNLIATAIDESREIAENNNSSSTPPAYDKLIARVEQNTTRIYELLSTINQTASSTRISDVTRRVQDTERALNEAITTFEKDESAARVQLVAVLQRTQRLIVYLTELEVTENVKIETLLPVVLTEEEENKLIVIKTSELSEKVLTLKFIQEETEEESVKDKIALALEAITELSIEMSSTTEDFTVFQLAANEAHAIADDMITSLQGLISIDKEILITVNTSTTTASSTEANQATSTKNAEIDTASSTEEINSDSAVIAY